MCDVDGFISWVSKDTSLSDRGQFLCVQQREQWPLTDVHHGSRETHPSFSGRRSQGCRGRGGRNRRGMTRRRGDLRRRIWCRCRWGARSRIIPADNSDRTRWEVVVNKWHKAEERPLFSHIFKIFVILLLYLFFFWHKTTVRTIHFNEQTGLYTPVIDRWTHKNIYREMHSKLHAKINPVAPYLCMRTRNVFCRNSFPSESWRIPGQD